MNTTDLFNESDILAAMAETSTFEWVADGKSTVLTEPIRTQDTLDQFRAAREKWAEPGVCWEEGTTGNISWISVNHVQAVKRQPPRSLFVADIGECRLAWVEVAETQLFG